MSRRPRFRLRLTGRGKARLGAHREARSHDARPSEQGGTPARSALAGAESQPGSSAAVKVEEELRARNEFIQTILDNLPIGLAVHNIEDGTASYGNAKFLEIYGWTEADVTNVESFFEHVYPDPAYREKIQTRVMLDMASGDPEAMCWSGMEATRKDGSKRIIEARNIPLFEQGLMISTVTDITEKTRQQEKILQLERQVHLAQRLESVGRLAGGIAHDFNNLLTVVSSYAELALGSLSEGDPLRADLAQILEAADRGSRLTKHLLAISRRQVLEPKIIDLNANLDSLNPMLRR
ncbi:MAG: PAS domain S-box protein, partial [Polyangia bacterium]|nr:PAS domain S-box protein [Polyangia bacterium]